MFTDRSDAGRRLAAKLTHHRGGDAVVLAIPCGGAEVGDQVASTLGLPFDLIIVRKLPMPDNPEAGFGAVAEDGSSVMISGVEEQFGHKTVRRVHAEQCQEIQRRICELRNGRELPPLEGRRVILVDDGVAMGSTMRAAIRCCRNRGAAAVTVAVPVAGPRIIPRLEEEADEVVAVESPRGFRAVAQVYRRWYDVPDAEVVTIMRRREWL